MKFSRGRYRGIKPRPFMKIITLVQLAMLNKHMEFGKGQTRQSGCNKKFIFIAPPTASPVAKVHNF